MKFRNLIAAAAVAALPLSASAATLIVPAAGTGPGANASHWQSELTVHNAAPRVATLSISFHRGTDVLGPVPLTVEARQTLSVADIVHTKFGLDSGTGALVIDMTDRDSRAIAVTSRTFNTSAAGEFGQDIPSIDAAAALHAGDIAALPGPSSVAENRFNFGLYVTEAASIDWQVVRANGVVVATKNVNYAAGTHAQYNGGTQALIGVTPLDNDTVQARVKSGRAVFYGSVINGTGDPTFIPGIRTREDILIQLTGVDLDENGSIDIADQNGDGVLDAPVQIFKSLFPNYFKVVAKGEFDEAVTLEIVSAPGYARLLDADGTLIVIADGAETATATGQIVLKATSEGSSQLITIPLVFK
ncbi:MAG TPA: hypothetical protein VFV49_09105 [Thermoanaerobaculia bacterium]|nr:hypothetical protein [Thermoanaerobaculia bacterium]